MKSPLVYYLDPKLEKRLAVNETGEPIIDWGESIPGKKKEMTLYVKNESKDQLVLRQPYSTSADLKIEDYTTRIRAEQVGTVKLSFKLNTESIQRHQSSWGFEIVIG